MFSSEEDGLDFRDGEADWVVDPVGSALPAKRA